MKMSDKDLDQLFSSKLTDMETEPSPMVWDNIDSELHGPAKRRKSAIPFMRIAATIVVIMGVSLVFIRPKSNKISLYAAADHTVETSDEGVTNDQVDGSESNPNPSADVATKTAPNGAAIYHPVNVKHNMQQVVTHRVDTASNLVAEARPTNVELNTTPIAAAVQNVQFTDNTNMQPTKSSLPAKQVNVVANNTLPVQKTPEPAKKKRIHTLGDLLNVVIAKVDKREDKLIQFTNSSDDDSFSVTGVNLGIVSAKKDK